MAIEISPTYFTLIHNGKESNSFKQLASEDNYGYTDFLKKNLGFPQFCRFLIHTKLY